MTSGNDLIANNWKTAECAFYATGTGIAQEVVIASALTKFYWGVVGALAVNYAFEFAAGLAGCNNNPADPEQGSGRCKEVDGCGNLWAETTDQGWLPLPTGSNATEARKVNSVTFTKGGGGCRAWQWYVQVDAVACDGSPTSSAACADYDYTGEWELRPQAGSTCTGSQPGPLPPGAIGEPTTVADGECNWTFTPKDSFIDASGAVRVYYVIEADNDACGGPFAYWSGPSDPTPVNPNPPDCPEGEDCDPIPPEPLPCCDDIKELLEQIKDCACKDPKPELRGDWRSVHFESDAPSPGGTRPLRKYFRYRSESGSTVAQLGAHWKDFTWQAGSVIVVHKGAWWGQAKVWAASIDEGKRVIRHAAAEAGIDPDQVGEWVVTGSSDPRYGMSGTMRPVLYDGLTWATARTGPSGPPMLESDS